MPSVVGRLLAVIGFLLFISTGASAGVPLKGMVLSGAEFGAQNLPGVYGRDYTYPTTSEIDYFVTTRHMNILRLPFTWERLQPKLFGAFNATELSRIDAFVDYTTKLGAYVLLDPHNYARYYGSVIGEGWVTAKGFADLWSRLAARYASNPLVVFGLMNEPHDMATETWLADAQAATNAIRATGAKNLILVPGNSWTGAWAWTESWYGTSNATVMLNFRDPGDNYAFEVHQYFDADSSGTSSDCVTENGFGIVYARLDQFTRWAQLNHRRAFLGEFAGANNPTCLDVVENVLTYIDNSADVFLGWTWWASGPWWGTYMFSLEPTNTFTAAVANLLWRNVAARTKRGF